MLNLNTISDDFDVPPNQRPTFKYIQKILASLPGWFISGSFANPKINYPGDVDLYFLNQEIYKEAKVRFIREESFGTHIKSALADTYYFRGLYLPIQLITKHFGPPQEIFNDMDLNVCKQAILPDGKHILDATALNPLELGAIGTISTDSFERYVKYYRRYNPKRNLDKAFSHLFDRFLEDTTFLKSYYAKVPAQPANQVLYKLFKTHQKDRDYISNRVEKHLLSLIHNHVPELLV